MNLGAAIKKIRKEKGISQADLSKKISVSQTSISQIESGAKWPHRATLIMIAGALNIPVFSLFIHSVEKNDIRPGKRHLYDAVYPDILTLLKKLL